MIDENKYITFLDAAEYTQKNVGMGKKALDKILVQEGIEYFYLNKTFKDWRYIERDKLYTLVEKQKKFWDNHYTKPERYAVLERSLIQYGVVEIPRYARFKMCTVAFEKKKIDLAAQLYSRISKEFVGEKEMIRMLKISNRSTPKIRKNPSIEHIDIVKELGFNKGRREVYYKKNDLENYLKEEKKKISTIGESILTVNQIVKEYGIGYGGITRNIKRINDKNILASTKEKNLFYRKDVEKYIAETSILRTEHIISTSDYTTFLERVELLKPYLQTLYILPITFEYWKKFVKRKLSNIQYTDTKSGVNKMRDILNLTYDFNQLLLKHEKKEVFEISSGVLNMWMEAYKGLVRKKYFYDFLKYISLDIKLLKNADISFHKDFAATKFIDYSKKRREEIKTIVKDIDIYEYEDYLQLYKHLNNLDLHIKRFFEFRDNEKLDEIQYISVWMYELLHLNLAWRNGDVASFPRIGLEKFLLEFNIDSVEWFRTNRLTENQIIRIITEITNYTYLINKTGVYSSFICSDILKESIATGIMLLESYWTFELYQKCEKPGDSTLLNFKTRHNEPTITLLKKPLKGLGIKEFVFGSRKMNRSVLTFLYNVSQALNPSGYNSLLLPQYLRNHIESMSTIQYIKFSEEQLQFLSGELFQRGEFGFITDKFLEIVSEGKSDRRVTNTKDIKLITKFFGSTQKMERVTRILNHFSTEKYSILTEMYNTITPKGLTDHEIAKFEYDTALDMLNKIYMGLLPSREPGVQCLYSEQGCKDRHTDCYGCKYSILNIYILRNLCDALNEDISEYFKTIKVGKKIKLSAKIHKKVYTLMESIERFGGEYVYSCLGMDREKFIALFDAVQEISNLKGSV